MRFVFVPKELTPMHLLEFWDAYPELGDVFQDQVNQKFGQGLYEEALNLVEPLLSYALAARDHRKASLLLLYKADLLHRLQSWGDALAHVQKALRKLRMQVSQIAIYNRAIAHYWEGLLHYIMRADDKALEAFAAARKLLQDSELYWGFQNNAVRVSDCQNLDRWIKNLLDLRTGQPRDELALILPLYELVNLTLIRTNTISLNPFQVMIPAEVLALYLPSGYMPIEVESLPFLYLKPNTSYIAFKVPESGYLLSESHAGDVILLEVVSSAAPATALALSLDRPFVRQRSGHIYFRPRQQDINGILAIPRFLIREENEA
ncbi:MAG: hypothetical protein JXA21_12285 [Anaerolineae bacterium]|nr:hypothetical protein [Anaerolineae bacterium]